jgi:hypothetical protein
VVQQAPGQLVGGDGGLALVGGADEEVHTGGQIEERFDRRGLVLGHEHL